MSDDPYRFGFGDPSEWADWAADEIPDEFSRARCGHWVEDGDICNVCGSSRDDS